MIIDTDGWFEPAPGLSKKEAACQSGAFVKGRPNFIMAHWTGGYSLQSAVNWLTSERAKASAHVVIDRDGSLAQLVSTKRVAWHAGASEWKLNGRKIKSLNRYSFGLEFVNLGRLRKTQSGVFLSYTGRPVPPAEVVQSDDGKYYQAYTEKQLASGEEVMLSLVEAYPSIIDVIGHHDVAPTRKIDPGPEFPFDYFRSRLFGRADVA